MVAILNGGELTLSGDVGDDWFGDGFTHADVVVALAQIEDDADLTVRLNSGGGIASEGAAIHAALSARAGTTNVIVEGVAASAASLIAMAGETVTMSAGSIMMIHDPGNISAGTAANHAKSIEYLEALATSYARVYAAKSGKTAEECRTLMKAETWLTPEQAVDAGFADAPGEARAKAVAAFDYQGYAHAPKRLTALAKKNGWLREAVGPRAAVAAQPGQQKEQSMTDKERADALAAELAELKKNQPDTATAVADAVKVDRERRGAIMALPEAKGRETLAQHLFDTGATADAAKATLAVAGKAEASTDDTTEFEQRRLNGDGLNGGRSAPKAKTDQATATAAGVANMRKLLGQKETV